MNRVIALFLFSGLELAAAAHSPSQKCLTSEEKKAVLSEFDPLSCEQHAQNLFKQLMEEVQQTIVLRCQLKRHEGPALGGLYYVGLSLSSCEKKVEELTAHLARLQGVEVVKAHALMKRYTGQKVLRELIGSEQTQRAVAKKRLENEGEWKIGFTESRKNKIDAASNKREAQYRQELLALQQYGNSKPLSPSNSPDQLDQLLMRALKFS